MDTNIKPERLTDAAGFFIGAWNETQTLSQRPLLDETSDRLSTGHNAAPNSGVFQTGPPNAPQGPPVERGAVDWFSKDWT